MHDLQFNYITLETKKISSNFDFLQNCVKECFFSFLIVKYQSFLYKNILFYVKFQGVANNIEGWLNVFFFFAKFGQIFLWMIATCTTLQNWNPPPLPQRRKKEIALRVEKLIIIHGFTILMKTIQG
jgi:hypothetical protein